MGRAGEYDTRLRWLQCVKTINTTNGDREGVFVPNGYLWCAVEETNSRRQSEYNATQTGADVEIRVRNYPDLEATDRLQDVESGYVYKLDGIRNGDDELIVDGYRLDVLNDTDVDESGG